MDLPSARVLQQTHATKHEGAADTNGETSTRETSECDLRVPASHHSSEVFPQLAEDSPNNASCTSSKPLTLEERHLGGLDRQQIHHRSEIEENDGKDGSDASCDDSLHLPPVLKTPQCTLKQRVHGTETPCSLTMQNRNHLLSSALSKHLLPYTVKQPSPLHSSVLLETGSEEEDFRDEKAQNARLAERSTQALVTDNDDSPDLLPDDSQSDSSPSASEDESEKRTGTNRVGSVLHEDLFQPGTPPSPTPELTEGEPECSLYANLCRVWLVQTDISRLVADHDVAGLLAAREEQEDLSFQYRRMRIEEDLASPDPRTMISWYRILAAIGNKQPAIYAQAQPWCSYPDFQVREAQKDLTDTIDAGLAQLDGEGDNYAPRRLGLPPIDQSKVFDCRDTSSWTVTRAPVPDGPTIDDAGQSVMHYVMYTSHNLIDPEAWSAEDLADIQQNGLGGFLGFRGTPAVGLDIGRGHTGMLGVRNIEMAIKTRFDVGKHKLCWIVGPNSTKKPHGLSQVDIWIAKKAIPALTHFIKLWEYMRMLNGEVGEEKI